MIPNDLAEIILGIYHFSSKENTERWQDHLSLRATWNNGRHYSMKTVSQAPKPRNPDCCSDKHSSIGGCWIRRSFVDLCPVSHPGAGELWGADNKHSNSKKKPRQINTPGHRTPSAFRDSPCHRPAVSQPPQLTLWVKWPLLKRLPWTPVVFLSRIYTEREVYHWNHFKVWSSVAFRAFTVCSRHR